jgi:transcriptional regulator with XRE-family HTH domain
MKSIYRVEYKRIIDWLVSKRLLEGITQEQLAEKLNQPQSFVSKYENCERRLDIIEFVEICRALNAKPPKTLLSL